MPNRGELALPARLQGGATAQAASVQEAWLIVGICTTGALLSIYLAACAVPFAQVPMLIAQVPWG
jgi:hypothetical protein